MSESMEHYPSSILYRSLFSWISTFDHIKSHSPVLTCLSDLADSKLFVECVKIATPIHRSQSLQNSIVQKIQFDTSPVADHSHQSNFSNVISTFSEFFGFALDQAISIPELLTRNEPEFIKLVLVFLAYALQQKPNELIIQKILILETSVQVTLRKLIEEMFQKLGSKQRDIIRDLIIESDLELSQSQEDQDEDNDTTDSDLLISDNTDTTTQPLQTSPELPEPPDILPADKLIIEPISPLYNSPPVAYEPQEEFSQFGVTSRYYGFDSPAALKWINQPNLRRIKRQDSSIRIYSSNKVDEYIQLQYKINQQQEEIHTLNQFCHECENELAEKNRLCNALESECGALRNECQNSRDLEDEKVLLCQENQRFEEENKTLKQEISTLSEFREKCIQLKDMGEELASTAKDNQFLLLNAEKLQLELTEKKDLCFKLGLEKGSLERERLDQQTTIEMLQQKNEKLESELDVMRHKVSQLDADLINLKEGEVREIRLDSKEADSGRSDEIALLFKIKLLEEKIHELRKLAPLVAEKNAVEVELHRVKEELEVMKENKQELSRLYSEVKGSNLRLEGKSVEFEKCKDKLESAEKELTSFQKENSSLRLELQSNSSAHRTMSTEKDRLQLCLDQSEREKEMLKRRVTELDATLISVQETYNELFSLKQKLVLDNDNLEKELTKLKAGMSLLQERERSATSELEKIISQRSEEHTGLNEKLTVLQETNCSMQSELMNLQLKLSSITSECVSKDETISTLSESYKKQECDLSAAFESVKRRKNELQSEINQIKCELASIQGQMESSSKRYERKVGELENEMKEFKRYKKELEHKLENSANQFAEKEQMLQKHVDSLEENVQALVHNNQSLQEEKHRLTAIVKEYENMEAENNLRVREELDEKRNRVRLLEEKLDDIENERNSLHSQVRSLNVQLQFAETQLMGKKKSIADSDKFSRPSYRAENINVPSIRCEPKKFTNISTIPSSHHISRSDWGKPVETIYSQTSTARSNSRAALYSSSIEPETSVSSLAEIGAPHDPPQKVPLYRTDEIKRRNAQNLPHLKSSYPVEFQTTTISERYLHSENPDVNPLYQPAKMSQAQPIANFIAENHPKRKALAFDIDVGASDVPKTKKEKDNDATQQPRTLRSSHKAKPAAAPPASVYRKRKN